MVCNNYCVPQLELIYLKNKTMKKLIFTFLLILVGVSPLSAYWYVQDESVALGTICPSVNFCKVYKFIISENQSYYDFLYMSWFDYSSLNEREKNYYISAMVNASHVKNWFNPLYK